MRKQQIENAAFEVATQVRVVEESIDSALAEIAELQARMIRVSTVARAGYGTINPALEQLTAAVNGLVTARGGVARCHVELAEAKQLVPGLRTVSWGNGEECPESARADLRIVA
jgi:hypothetical protein